MSMSIRTNNRIIYQLRVIKQLKLSHLDTPRANQPNCYATEEIASVTEFSEPFIDDCATKQRFLQREALNTDRRSEKARDFNGKSSAKC